MIFENESHQKRILIADDVESNRQVLNILLRNDYQIDFAIHGQEVLDKLSQHDFDIVLLDIRMPVLDGLETLKIIRKESNPASLPIVITSAMDDYKTIVQGLELGANDYITKPIDPHIVRARVKTQLNLKHIMDERNEVIRVLERMMDIAKHDLKNPLTNLSLIINILKGLQFEHEMLPDFIGMARDSINSMLDIIDDFLSGSNLFDESTLPQSDNLSGKFLVDTIAQQYHVRAHSKQINMVLEEIEDAQIIADSKRITQVISNLISNAIKYTPCNGSVYIRAFSTQEDSWRLEIQDTGSGIPFDEQKYLFQAFSKDKISTKPTNGETSTGLGLWIAAEMMRIQNGKIGMNSPQSGGCCFWIEIPCVMDLSLELSTQDNKLMG